MQPGRERPPNRPKRAKNRLKTKPADHGQFRGPVVGVLPGTSRPCGLACLGIAGLRRRAARSVSPQRKTYGAGRYSAAPSALPRDPTQSGTACARFTAAPRCGAQGYTERARGPGLVGHPSSRDPAPPPWSCRSPQPVGSHRARPFAFGGAPPFLCRHPLRAGEVRPGGRPWRWPPPGGPGPPVPRPARARVLARALADERRPGVASVLPAPETTPTRCELY